MNEPNSTGSAQSFLARTHDPRCVLRFARSAAAAAAFALLTAAIHAQPSVLQRGYNASATGANLNETILNTSNVVSGTFGLVFKLPVVGSLYAQPLYVPRVAIPKRGMHNVVYVATMSDMLYAFDADTAGPALWRVNVADLVVASATPVPMSQFAFGGNRNIVGNLGILSTPVIDASNNLMYVVACTLESDTMVYRLHAFDIRSGAEPLGPGVEISGNYGGQVFDARYVTQRVSLTLADNQVVFGFGAVENEYPNAYTGWVMAYDKTTLVQSGIFATITTSDNGGGVWQAGRPPVVGGGGDVYIFTGNGYTAGYNGVTNFSESVLKLNPAKGLQLVDWFTPDNWSDMDSNDQDLSSSGPMMIPGTQLLTGGGKTGILYILNDNKLGGFTSNDSGVVQEQQVAAEGLRGGPVYWQRSGGPLLYVWGAADALKAYPFTGTMIATNPSAEGGNATQLWPGGILALSANGSQQGSGVLWANVVVSGNPKNGPPVPGALYAFDAGNVATELWDSTMNSSDSYGLFAKYVPPLVVNGKVYMATSSNQLVVYGLLP
jgi:hypothetical protein